MQKLQNQSFCSLHLRRLTVFFVLVIALISSATSQASTQIKDVRLWTAPDHTRLVFDLSDAAKYELFRLHNPERIVIDIDNSKMSANASKLALPDTVLLSIRYGSQKGNTTRIVLDVRNGVSPRTFLLKKSSSKPHRLVIDLYPKLTEQNPTTTVTSNHKNRDIIIAVDAGHGGEDPGAIGKYKLQEKKVTLAVAKSLADRINTQPGMKAVLVRDGDYYVSLRNRVKKVRDIGADMMISIHADAVGTRSVKGASVYTLSESGATPDRVAAALAAKENAADEIGGASPEAEVSDPFVRGILGDMAKRDGLDSSEMLANIMLGQLKEARLPIKYDRPKHARFAVLTTLEIPCVLVEMDYISNPTREKLLQDAAHQSTIAESMFTASKAFFTRMGRLNDYAEQYHTVNHGESLWSIAKRYGVSVNDIRKVNQLDHSSLKVGQRLQMPQS